jgi:excisionase family DNA binding protein
MTISGAEHSPGPEPALMTREQAAGFLGMSVSTLKRLSRAGKIGPTPLKLSGRLVRWSRAELSSWTAAGCPGRREWAARRGTK